MGIGFEDFVCDLVGVVDLADRGDREAAVVRANQDGLRFVVGDTADAQIAVHGIGFAGEFRAERCIFNVVNCFIEAVFFAVNGHARATGPEVRVIVYTEKQVKYAIFF